MTKINSEQNRKYLSEHQDQKGYFARRKEKENEQGWAPGVQRLAGNYLQYKKRGWRKES